MYYSGLTVNIFMTKRKLNDLISAVWSSQASYLTSIQTNNPMAPLGSYTAIYGLNDTNQKSTESRKKINLQ